MGYSPWGREESDTTEQRHFLSHAANAGYSRDVGSIPGWGRSPGGGHGNPPQYSCLERPTDRSPAGAVQGVTVGHD